MDLNLQSRGLVIVVICHGVSLVQDLNLRVKFLWSESYAEV